MITFFRRSVSRGSCCWMVRGHTTKKRMGSKKETTTNVHLRRTSANACQFFGGTQHIWGVWGVRYQGGQLARKRFFKPTVTDVADGVDEEEDDDKEDDDKEDEEEALWRTPTTVTAPFTNQAPPQPRRSHGHWCAPDRVRAQGAALGRHLGR